MAGINLTCTGSSRGRVDGYIRTKTGKKAMHRFVKVKIILQLHEDFDFLKVEPGHGYMYATIALLAICMVIGLVRMIMIDCIVHEDVG
mmetsp:Transcript_36091/g.66700  ORF Transcript_36091/g.66700 Transcript_36091/m.66700 type:complete len:88 (+) Transcript_36091:321-584(+)